MPDPKNKPNLTRQRLFIALFFGAAILISVMTIVGTLMNRDDADYGDSLNISAPASTALTKPAPVSK